MGNYESFIDYYKVLGVSRTASEEEIKSAYKELAKEKHPDKHTGEPQAVIDQATKEFQLINEAYEQIGNESKSNNRAQYNIMYDQYYATKRQREQEARQAQNARDQQQKARTENASSQTQRQQQSSHKNTSSTSRNQKAAHSADKGKFQKAFYDIKTAWQEVRKEEKKAPFLKRHKTLSGRIHRNYYKQNGDNLDNFVFILKSGSLHIFAELLYQLNKLTHITEDSVPKYIMRNRVMAYVIALATVLSLSKINNEKQSIIPPSSSESYLQQTPDAIVDIIDDGSYTDEQNKMEQFKEDRNYVVMRTYTIKENDTLSQLAEDANTTVESIMAVNTLESPDLIKYGETICIPYLIKEEDLKHSTVAAYYQPGTDISIFAERYDTDEASIYALNKEAIENGKVISDTLLVPTFTSRSDVTAIKASASYTYTNSN